MCLADGQWSGLLGVSSDTQEPSGLRAVSVEDPVIQEAAEHAIKGLNNKSNSLVPYKLKEILSAHAEVCSILSFCCYLLVDVIYRLLQLCKHKDWTNKVDITNHITILVSKNSVLFEL